MSDIINSIYSVRTVSGAEHGFTGFIKEQLGDFCDEIYNDSIGNVYALKKGRGKQCSTVAVVCAVDEPGFVVTCVEPDGKVRLHGIGTKAWQSYAGAKATAEDGTQGILLTDVSDASKISADDFYFEIGAADADDITLSEGAFVHVDMSPVRLGKNRISLGVMGEKAFASAIIDIAKYCGDYCFDLCFVFVSQHLLGARGEKCAAYNIKADTVIALTSVADKKIGEGAVVCTADSGGKCNRTLCTQLSEAAESIGVNCRMYADICKEKPSFVAPFLAENSEVAVIGVPCNSNCGANICDLRDVRSAAAIACAYLIFRDEKEEIINE